MNRIEKTFTKLKKQERAALVTFITAGDPDRETSQGLLNALAEAGADIIELGMPFTDPMADGPVIQAASLRALKAGASMKQTLSMVRELRKTNSNTPLILMGYYNPVMAYGVEPFIKDAAKAGVDGLIIVDLPPEESREMQEAAQREGLDFIRLITPTTDEARLKVLLENSSGFLYYVSITGVTGTARANLKTLKPHIETIKTHTDLPIAIGFGIKTPDDAAQMAEIGGDAVVVGSSLVHTLSAQGADACLAQIKALAGALKP